MIYLISEERKLVTKKSILFTGDSKVAIILDIFIFS